jgi:DNA-binding transcriptional LysR family regulator
LDRITIMRSFVSVAHADTFTKAARSLGISGSLVSRHVAELERQLGIRLVNRTARSVSLTEAGVRYSEFADRILRQIEEEDAALLGLRNRPEGTLSIICPKWIGNLNVGDAIAAFAVKYPKIVVRFEIGGLSDRTHEFLNQGYDIAFHTRQVRDSGLMLKKVANLKFLLCASPRYLQASGEPADTDELLEHDCLVHSNYPIWNVRQGGRDLHLKVTRAVYISNSYLTLQKAAVAGRGVTMLPVGPAAEDLAAGRLVRILPKVEVPDRTLYAIYAPGNHTLARVRLFLDFVAEWFRLNPMSLEVG